MTKIRLATTIELGADWQRSNWHKMDIQRTHWDGDTLEKSDLLADKHAQESTTEEEVWPVGCVERSIGTESSNYCLREPIMSSGRSQYRSINASYRFPMDVYFRPLPTEQCSLQFALRKWRFTEIRCDGILARIASLVVAETLRLLQM